MPKRKFKPPKRYYEGIVRIEDDGIADDGIVYLTRTEIKKMLISGEKDYTGVKIRVCGLMELPSPEEI